MNDLAISKNSIHPEQTEIIMYQTEDGLTKIDVRMENETVWLTQAQMAELFQRERSGITKHIKNVFAEGEVDEKSNVKNVHIANSDKPVAYYSLDVIISVGYRVKSLRGTQFRIWANSVLKEYLIKGFAMNDELLKQAGGGNYFDELMDRIRDIRSSERVNPKFCVNAKLWCKIEQKYFKAGAAQAAAAFSTKITALRGDVKGGGVILRSSRLLTFRLQPVSPACGRQRTPLTVRELRSSPAAFRSTSS